MSTTQVAAAAVRTHPSPRRLVAVAATGAVAIALLGAATQADARILPGKGVKGVTLGDSAARVQAVLGRPERGSNILNYRYIRRHGLGVYFIAGRAFEITVLRRTSVTTKRIGVGSSLPAVRRAYRAAACRRGVVRNTVECRLRGRFRGRATETLFTARRGKVIRVAIRYA